MKTSAMPWLLCLGLFTSLPLLVTSGNDPTSATSEEEHSGDHVTNYTPPRDVTTGEASGHDATVPIATEDPTIQNGSQSISSMAPAGVSTIKPNVTNEKTSRNQTGNSTAHASDQTDPTTVALQDSTPSKFPTTGDVTSTSATQTSKTSHPPTPSVYTQHGGSVSTAASLKNEQKPELDVDGANGNASGVVNGSSSLVPADRILTTRFPSQTTQPGERPAGGTTPEVLASGPDVVALQGSDKEAPPSTESPMVQQTPPDILAKLTKSTLTTPYTTNALTEEWSTTQELDEDGKEKVVFEEDGSHQETAYERSLRTRRVINHAALWITIGFVVVLVSYITVLVIYNRTRPEWQDPQRPYSRFENEAEDFPETNENETENENSMDSENQDLIQHFPPNENRRDFSQCVDSRDFPPCEGDQEYLLYEDPTCVDGDTCTEFTYRDQ